jgi:hypothetical protein
MRRQRTTSLHWGQLQSHEAMPRSMFHNRARSSFVNIAHHSFVRLITHLPRRSCAALDYIYQLAK